MMRSARPRASTAKPDGDGGRVASDTSTGSWGWSAAGWVSVFMIALLKKRQGINRACCCIKLLIGSVWVNVRGSARITSNLNLQSKKPSRYCLALRPDALLLFLHAAISDFQ